MSEHPNGDTPPWSMNRAHPRVGPKKDAAGAMPAILPSDHETIKSILRPKIARFCENIAAGVDNKERNSMNLFARIMGAIGAEIEINVNMACEKAFNMPATEVAEILAEHRRSSATSIEGCQEDGLALLDWVCEQEPERRAAIVAHFGGGNALALGSGSNHS